MHKMSKFRKVSETENIPSFIEKKFVGASYEAFDDPYAELKNNSTENRIKISKQTIGNQKTAENFTKSWEKIQGASVYEEPQYNFNREELTGLNSIRRAGSDFDEGMNARTTTSGLKAYSADEYMNAMLSRSASIFNPDMIALSEEFLNSQESTSQQAMVNEAQRREAKASRHNSWEEKQLNQIRKSSVVSNRAHSVLRTANEGQYSSQFGMIDVDSLDNRETQRLAMNEKSREQRLGLKKNHTEDLENRAVNKAQTIHDIYNNININLDIDKI
jgi:hypothetical protein